MSEFLDGNGNVWYSLLTWSAILVVVIFIRYLIFSQLFEYLVRYLQESIQWSKRVLTQNQRIDHQKKREIILSFWTSIIFAVMGAGLIFLWYKGYTRLYHDWDAYPMYWLVLGPIFFLLLQETYYYWLHRWMHLPKVYRLVHQKHHDSIETSAWTAFSFHPIESVLQALFIPATVMLLPIQEYLFLGLLMFMTLSATINHAGLEVYPKWFLTKRPFCWFIGATHHDLHHRRFLCNYGLYFTFWDHWMGTESKEYAERLHQMNADDMDYTDLR